MLCDYTEKIVQFVQALLPLLPDQFFKPTDTALQLIEIILHPVLQGGLYRNNRILGVLVKHICMGLNQVEEPLCIILNN